MRENYTLPRLYLDQPLEGEIELSREQAHYLGSVLRKREGDRVRVFNGRDGELAADIIDLGRKSMRIRTMESLRSPVLVPDVRLLFSPLRKHRTAMIFEKATELGVRTLQPVITERTQFPKLNLDRARVQIIEAAEQTERMDLPDLVAPVALDAVLEGGRTLIFADEAEINQSVLPALRPLSLPLDLLIGPEGGFTPAERDRLRERAGTHAVSLGPRILRADTAAISLLTLVQATVGDWNTSA